MSSYNYYTIYIVPKIALFVKKIKFYDKILLLN